MARTRKDLVTWFTFILFMLGMTAVFADDAVRTANFTYQFDVDSSSYAFCRLEGQNNDPFSGAIPGRARIKTVGSNTTVSEFTASTNPFTDVAIGDVLQVVVAGVPTTRMVTARASAASITVDTAIDLSATGGYTWTFWKHVCGATANDGWIDTKGASYVGLTTQFEQGDITSLDIQFQCKADGKGSLPVVVYPGETSDCGIGGTLSTDRCNFLNAVKGTDTARLTVVLSPALYSACRVGFKWVGADTADGTTNLEKFTSTITVGVVHP